MCRRFGTIVASPDRIIYKAMIPKVKMEQRCQEARDSGNMKLLLRKIIGNQQIQFRKVVKCTKREDVMPKFFAAYIIPQHDLNPKHKATWFNIYSDLFALFSQTLFCIPYSWLLEWDYWLCIWSIWSLWLWPQRRLWTFQQWWVIKTLMTGFWEKCIWYCKMYMKVFGMRGRILCFKEIDLDVKLMGGELMMANFDWQINWKVL